MRFVCKAHVADVDKDCDKNLKMKNNIFLCNYDRNNPKSLGKHYTLAFKPSQLC